MSGRGLKLDYAGKGTAHRRATQHRSVVKPVEVTSEAGRAWTAQVAAVALALVVSAPAVAQELETTEATFNRSCAGCHANGGNIVQAGKTLFLEDLQRFNVADQQSLYDIIYKGKNKMPGFGKDCAPKGQCTFGPRLSDEEVTGLASYVRRRAAQGWK